MNSDYSLGSITLFPDVEKTAYCEAFNNLKVIKKLRLQLVYPNPRLNQLSDEIRNKLLIEPNSSKSSVECEGKDSGLERDSEIVKFAKEFPTITPEYGSVEVTGSEEEGGPNKVISTYGKALKTSTEVPSKDSNSVWDIMKNILRKHNRL